MNLTVSKNVVYIPKAWGNDKAEEKEQIKIRYDVLTAVEMEDVVVNKPKDTELFKRFVTDINNLTWDGIPVETADGVLEIPGSYGLVSEVAQEIVGRSLLKDVEKNVL